MQINQEIELVEHKILQFFIEVESILKHLITMDAILAVSRVLII